MFDWMTDPNDVRSRDRAGDLRVRENAVDMGAFEYLTQGAFLMVR